MTAPTTAEPRITVDLARRVLDHIDAHPELHMQSGWIAQNDCGTAGDFAGWAVLLSGAEPQWSPYGDAHRVRYREQFWSVANLARDLLGLSWPDADLLFAPTNTRAELHAIVRQLAAGKPARTW